MPKCQNRSLVFVSRNKILGVWRVLKTNINTCNVNAIHITGHRWMFYASLNNCWISNRGDFGLRRHGAHMSLRYSYTWIRARVESILDLNQRGLSFPTPLDVTRLQRINSSWLCHAKWTTFMFGTNMFQTQSMCFRQRASTQISVEQIQCKYISKTVNVLHIGKQWIWITMGFRNRLVTIVFMTVLRRCEASFDRYTIRN